MPFPFAREVAPYQRRNLFVGGAGSHQRFHVILFDREQAVAQLAISGEPNAVAVATEGTAYGRDESDLSAAVGETVLRGRGARIGVRHRSERRDFARERLDDLVRQQYLLAVP